MSGRVGGQSSTEERYQFVLGWVGFALSRGDAWARRFVRELEADRTSYGAAIVADIRRVAESMPDSLKLPAPPAPPAPGAPVARG